MEAFDQYLLNKRGIAGTPLAYLVREVVDPQDDPGFGTPTITEDLINRAPHGDDPVYVEDNHFLFTLLRNLTQDGFAFTYVKGQARTRDGRAAYLQLKTMIFGQAFKTKIRAQADHIIANAKFTGYRGFSLDSYGIKIRDAYLDLERHGESIEGDRKVQAYLRGIKDPKLSAMKAAILADDDKGHRS